MIFPVLVGWMVGVPAAIWWPRGDSGDSARARAYRMFRGAASCLLPGYILWVLLLGLDPDDAYFRLLLLILAFLGLLALTPLALGMLALDLRNRPLGLIGSILAVLFSAGLTCYGLIVVLGVLIRAGIPLWQGAVAVATILLCGAATAFILEAYALLRLSRTL